MKWSRFPEPVTRGEKYAVVDVPKFDPEVARALNDSIFNIDGDELGHRRREREIAIRELRAELWG